MPRWVIGVHVAFLMAVVIFSHHAIVFLALFLFFLGFTEAYPRYQSRLMIREGLLVTFFLAGLVVLGGQQRWPEDGPRIGWARTREEAQQQFAGAWRAWLVRTELKEM
jgi:Putative Na+/H+ antiporter